MLRPLSGRNRGSVLISSAPRNGEGGQVVLATGLGKTVVMAEAVAQLYRDGVIPEGRVLVLAGTRELVDQLQRSFWDQLPKWISTHRLMRGEQPSYWDGITFATGAEACFRGLKAYRDSDWYSWMRHTTSGRRVSAR